MLCMLYTYVTYNCPAEADWNLKFVSYIRRDFLKFYFKKRIGYN